ncbi:molybdopterin biosynthesis enzyme [Sphingobium olei]
MDGFALASDFTLRASADDPVHMLVVERYGAAGVSPESLRAGEAARIATGAPVPDGADSVLIEEKAVSTMVGGGRRLSLTTPVPAGSNIRLPGEDVPAGAPLVARGKLLSPAGIGLMVAAGVPEVEVRRWPRVRLVSTGSELAADAASLDHHPARIPDSNGPMLMAALREIGLPYHSSHHAADEANQLEKGLIDQDADILISTGGVSAGDFDLIPGTLEKLGATIHLHASRQTNIVRDASG